MTITSRVKNQYFVDDKQLIRLPTSFAQPLKKTKRMGTPWTQEEHERFLAALEKYPSGPWKTIAAQVGTRTTRQTMTHAQKYRQKIARRREAIQLSGMADAVTASDEVTRTLGHSISSGEEIDSIMMELNWSKLLEFESDDSVLELLNEYEPLDFPLDASVPVLEGDSDLLFLDASINILSDENMWNEPKNYRD